MVTSASIYYQLQITSLKGRSLKNIFFSSAILRTILKGADFERSIKFKLLAEYIPYTRVTTNFSSNQKVTDNNMKNKIKNQKSEGTATIEVKSINEKQNKCDIFDYTSSMKSNVKKHLESVHDGIKPNKCSICDCSYSNKSALKRHVESVHGVKKPHKCSIQVFYL